MNFLRARQSVWLSVLLLGALLWASIWGQLHGIGHRDLPSLSAPLGLSSTHGPEVTCAKPSGDLPFDPLGHDAGSNLCQVLDHLAHADRMGTSAAVWSAPMVPAQTPLFLAHLSFDHDRWSQPQARAPPALI